MRQNGIPAIIQLLCAEVFVRQTEEKIPMPGVDVLQEGQVVVQHVHMICRRAHREAVPALPPQVQGRHREVLVRVEVVVLAEFFGE